MTRPVVSTGILAIVMLAAWLALSGGAFPDVPTSTAVQAPRMSLDMQPAGNSYSDSTNTMTVGAVDNCLTSDTGNGAQHNHVAHLIIQDVEDLVGWQARMNYDGARMRPSTVNFTPFTDNTTGQNVSFLNLPLDAGVHRDLVTATDIPPQSAALQTALIGAVYNGEQTVAVSPDTPAKLLPDDNSYSTSGGGVLAAVNVQVLSGQVGAQSLALDLDDILPSSPGSSITVFVGDGTTTTDLTEVQLGDGYHGEGAPCLPIPTAPPLPTPPPQREIVSLLPSDVVLPAVVLPDADLDGTADPLDLCPATQSGSAVNANGCSQLQDDPTGAPAALGRGFEDRPDDTTGYQVHYVYLVPIDRFDQSRDTSGFIERSTNAQNAWLRAKTRGQNRAWRVDTSGGSPDITFIQPPKTDQQFRDETAHRMSRRRAYC